MSPPGAIHARSFHGPRCWVLSTIAGALAGLLLSFLAPLSPAPSNPSAAHDAPRVVQTTSDGAAVERLADGSTIPAAPAPASGPANPASTSLAAAPNTHVAPPLWLVLPFALLLGSIALMPFVSAAFWHHHYPDFAFFLGSLVLAYSLAALGPAGRHDMLHASVEYYSFIALVGGLYIASGGILVNIRAAGSPVWNTLLLACGCVIANIVGTTGASVLLIRPFLRMNRGRLRPVHIVFFILTVSNCAGCLTPIGDPPLYLGFLKGVPFFWTLTHMWPMWLVVNGLLLGAFFTIDALLARSHPGRPPATSDEGLAPNAPARPLVTGWSAIACLVLLVAGVFIDPLIKQWGGAPSWLSAFPVGATFQIAMAVLAYVVGAPAIRNANQFTFEPVKEVGCLFVGIFLTMAPALSILSARASSLGLETPTQYYFLTGSLSAVLDNAPTYVSFLQVALGTLHVPLTPDGIRQFIDSVYDLTHASGPDAGQVVHFHGQVLLEAIALGAVFFGALTYIGNGPNFMVKSIVDAAFARSQAPDAAEDQKGLGVRMPSFFAYTLFALLILGPILVLNWFVFIR